MRAKIWHEEDGPRDLDEHNIPAVNSDFWKGLKKLVFDDENALNVNCQED